MKTDPTAPFEHRGRNGTIVRGRCDLRGGVDVLALNTATESDILHDVAQVFGYHGATILPGLPSFAGYDTVTLVVRRG